VGDPRFARQSQDSGLATQERGRDVYPIKRTPNPDEPWCLIWKVEWGVVQCIHVHLANAARYRRYGWRVLVSDLDVPLKLNLGEEWASQPVKKEPFYPPPIMRPPDGD
jgi:hypothetical protein